jgi:hypothetical protein
MRVFPTGKKIPASKQLAEKLKLPSFRGAPAEAGINSATRNRSFCRQSIQEGFLASLGMTALGLFSAACKDAGYKNNFAARFEN